MTRRQFAFWIGFGLFSLSDKLHINFLDTLAAATMDGAAPVPADGQPAIPEHWTVGGDDKARWFERENYISGEWVLTGRTTPVDIESGERHEDDDIYLDDRLVPVSMRSTDGAAVESIAAVDDEDSVVAGESETTQHAQQDGKPLGHLPAAARRSRHGRPPSKWLRSLTADELRIWLKTVKVPEAGVSGMTYWEHLTRDHMFDPDKLQGLTELEQADLHGAAHFGY